MVVTYKLVNYGAGDCPEDIKCFNTIDEAKEYVRVSDESLNIEDAIYVESGFEKYMYMHVIYRPGYGNPDVIFKTTTSLDKSIDKISSVNAYGDRVYVDVLVKNEDEGKKKLNKIIDCLNALFFDTRAYEHQMIRHNVGITDIDKDEFFKMIE